jgi:hypothetical protein
LIFQVPSPAFIDQKRGQSPSVRVRDNEVIEKAEEVGISLLFTGMRHFMH